MTHKPQPPAKKRYRLLKRGYNKAVLQFPLLLKEGKGWLMLLFNINITLLLNLLKVNKI